MSGRRGGQGSSRASEHAAQSHLLCSHEGDSLAAWTLGEWLSLPPCSTSAPPACGTVARDAHCVHRSWEVRQQAVHPPNLTFSPFSEPPFIPFGSHGVNSQLVLMVPRPGKTPRGARLVFQVVKQSAGLAGWLENARKRGQAGSLLFSLAPRGV